MFDAGRPRSAEFSGGPGRRADGRRLWCGGTKQDACRSPDNAARLRNEASLTSPVAQIAVESRRSARAWSTIAQMRCSACSDRISVGHSRTWKSPTAGRTAVSSSGVTETARRSWLRTSSGVVPGRHVRLRRCPDRCRCSTVARSCWSASISFTDVTRFRRLHESRWSTANRQLETRVRGAAVHQ